jgi:hypothetical protein
MTKQLKDRISTHGSGGLVHVSNPNGSHLRMCVREQYKIIH